jgi:hypothetical protein
MFFNFMSESEDGNFSVIGKFPVSIFVLAAVPDFSLPSDKSYIANGAQTGVYFSASCSPADFYFSVTTFSSE